jgi:hypothetical protein
MPFVKNNCEGTYAEKQQCGQKALLMFIYKNIKVPIIARENGIEGKTVIRFIIEKDGSISNIELIRNPGVGVGEKVYFYEKPIINRLFGCDNKCYVWTNA